ncbi:hypothetical protein JRO89_XS08G0038600 [Xanthoceras sorbifolium]|uniref:Uncharacterized protein n=1 Tax=Xanthoceras sorbifolium TaxID=99658 RepID=A0ABQ8HNL8_9ROSI|nr:hypothetical protein JRO89_XS08G0038600 [Xanthoceras sorbifolium]
MNYPENPNPNFSYLYDNFNPSNQELEVSDYLICDDGFDYHHHHHHHHHQEEDSSPSQSMASSVHQKYFVGDSTSGSNGATSRNSDMQVIPIFYIYIYIYPTCTGDLNGPTPVYNDDHEFICLLNM